MSAPDKPTLGEKKSELGTIGKHNEYRSRGQYRTGAGGDAVDRSNNRFFQARMFFTTSQVNLVKRCCSSGVIFNQLGDDVMNAAAGTKSFPVPVSTTTLTVESLAIAANNRSNSV